MPELPSDDKVWNKIVWTQSTYPIAAWLLKNGWNYSVPFDEVIKFEIGLYVLHRIGHFFFVILCKMKWFAYNRETACRIECERNKRHYTYPHRCRTKVVQRGPRTARYFSHHHLKETNFIQQQIQITYTSFALLLV